MRRRIPIPVSSFSAIPNKQQSTLHEAVLAFMAPTDLSLDSQSILELTTLERYGIVPASIISMRRSKSSDDAPEGCCHANMRIEETVSSTPRQRGAASPRKVDCTVMLGSLDDIMRAETICFDCKSIIDSAEQDVSEPSTIPAASRILEAEVSRVEPRDCPTEDCRTSNAPSTTPSSFIKRIASLSFAGAPALSSPSSYCPLAHARPISPTARAMAAIVSMAIFRRSAGRDIFPFSRTSDSKAGRLLSVAISRAASRQAPNPS